ncbi:hypothetical protein GMLC_30950 [Geomonas limicola]|uniref:histidine kinase n=1 Tax=Geomonas limicola TaxID=2740186 RepID=A0A6V8NAI4_9BACT|nr:PAS domain S-box protein [Geomonas limicola]GFO69516.1 hypothetical protein GMLC_30950 [Geomonas limicola]
MSWIIIAGAATASSVFVLAVVNLYLYLTYRERFMKFWAYAWGVHTCRYLFLIASVIWPEHLFLRDINYLCIIVSAVLLLTGTRIFIGKPVGRLETLIGLVIGSWTVLAPTLRLPAPYVVVPIFAFLSYTYIHTGMQFLKSLPRRPTSRITGWLFVLWGIHQADYPILRPIEWFAPWGFIIGSILATSIAMGLVLIYFERTYQTLREKEERHEQLIASSHNWIWEVNANAVYTYASPQVLDLLGYGPEEVVGKTPFDLMPDAEAKRIGAIFAAIAARQEPFFRLENTNRRKDGRLVVLETSGVPFFDSQGRFCGYRGMDHNITERKQTEVQRELVKQVLLVLNEPQDLKGSLAEVAHLIQGHMDLDAVGVRLQEGDDFPYHVQLGFPRDFLIKENTLIERNPNGESCRDEHGRVRLECACGLVLSGHVPKGHPLSTPAGSFWTNDSSLLLRLSPDQDPRHRPRTECIRQGYASTALIPIRYKDRIVGLIQCNDRRSDRFSVEVIQHLEGIAAYIGAALIRRWSEDERINLEKQLQQAQKMESVGRLAGGVAHDFNNMLGVIIGHAALGLMETAPGHPCHDHLEAINAAAERSAELTRQLLAFARRQAIEPRIIDIDDAIANMLKMLQRLIGEDIQLIFEPATRMWPVLMDPSQVDQIMANLCVNARDAITGTGRIVIQTGTVVADADYLVNHPEAELGEYVWVSVSDNGCGMGQETLPHIFEPFYTTKGIGEGTGLGLATIYGIVKQNRGFITVRSEAGQGAIFTIGIPRHRGAGAGPPRQEGNHALPTGSETILLVEDERGMLGITCALLKNQGYQVLASGAPDEAIQMAGAYGKPIDLLLTDVIMPGMNGKELAEQLKAKHPGLRCLFMSGYTADVIANHGVLQERIHFLQKPFLLPTLASKVREVLDLPC